MVIAHIKSTVQKQLFLYFEIYKSTKVCYIIWK